MPGGVQAQVLGLAQALRKLGHDTRVLAPCDGPPPDPIVTPLGKSIPKSSNGSIAPIAPDPACALRTIHALRNERFDILHLHEPAVPGPTMTTLLTADVPMVGTFHAAGINTAYERVGFAVRYLVRRLDERIAVSDDAMHTARSALGGTYKLLYNGIDIERFRREPRVVTHAKSIFFLGRHEDRKGLSVLLQALEFLPPDVEIWVGGDGPQTAILQQQFAHDSRVHWLGRISEPEKIRCLRSATLFCAPSVGGESFGLVLLEAMAAEVPIVASDIPGYANVTRDGNDACLVAGGDPLALANGIQSVLTDREFALQLVACGNERVAMFSMDRLAVDYISRFEELLR